MHPNYEYMLDCATKFLASGKILDYGCGEGDVVIEGRNRGLDIVGVEAFYAGSVGVKDRVIQRGLLNKWVYPLSKELKIPLDQNSFDMVICNQVMEHVEDLDIALSEIFRVLKPGGLLLTLFPDKSVWREGHCGIPFAHWFTKNSRLRYPYMRLMRSLGFGYHKNGKSQHQWTIDFMKWLDDFTFYRSIYDIEHHLQTAGFTYLRIEDDYIKHRLKNKGINIPSFIANNVFWKSVASYFCRKLGGLVILARKPQA